MLALGNVSICGVLVSYWHIKTFLEHTLLWLFLNIIISHTKFKWIMIKLKLWYRPNKIVILTFCHIAPSPTLKLEPINAVHSCVAKFYGLCNIFSLSGQHCKCPSCEFYECSFYWQVSEFEESLFWCFDNFKGSAPGVCLQTLSDGVGSINMSVTQDTVNSTSDLYPSLLVVKGDSPCSVQFQVLDDSDENMVR